MTQGFLETVTGKKVNQAPKYRARRRAAGAVLAVAGVPAMLGAGYVMDKLAPSTEPLKQESPTKVYGPSYKDYEVQSGDTVDGITHRAYPELEVGGLAFDHAAQKIDVQLPTSDQTMARIIPGEHLALAKNAKIGHLESGNSKNGSGAG